MGGGGNRFLPAATPNESIGGTVSDAIADVNRGSIPVALSVRIPRRHRGERTPVHPATISSLTQSLSIAVNNGAAKKFNTTPSSPNCSAGPGGTTCTFKIGAPPGADKFAVKTYSGTGGGGSVLDYGTAVVNIARGKSNSAHVNLGPVVSTTADTGMGSLRYAMGAASAGDTIMFLVSPSSPIVLSSPITVTNKVSLAGPGVTASARRLQMTRDSVHTDATYTGVTISGNNASQLFIVSAGGTLTVSGLILKSGQAAVAHNPGGAINNSGAVTLVNDVVTGNKSLVTTIKHVVHKTKHAHRVKPLRPGERPQMVPRSRLAQQSIPIHPNLCPPGTNTYGGAIYNNGVLNISGTTFDGNIAPTSNLSCWKGYGGAVYNDEYGILYADSSTFTNNSAYEGGAVYSYSYYGSVTFTNDKFVTNTGCDATSGCPTTGCTASGTCTGYAYGYGAALYDDDGPGAQFSNCTFVGNAVGLGPDGYGEGGALYLDTGHPSILNSTFTGNSAGKGSTNKASGYGGAIIHYDNTLTLNGDTFTSNQAGGDYYGYGGAIYSDEYINGSNDTFASNVASGTGSPSYTDGYAYGGALYGYYVTLTNSTFSSNQAYSAYESEGGAAYIYEVSGMSGIAFTSNQAVANSNLTGAYPYAYGGAIYLDDDLAISNSSFTSNLAASTGQYNYYSYGGAIYLESSYHLNSLKNTYTSNSATANGGYDSAEAYGGAVMNYGYFISNGDAFKSNSASATEYVYGGAIYTDSTLTMGNAVVSGNTASGLAYVYGGGIYNTSTANVTSSIISGNSATSSNYQGYGGGVYDDSSGTWNGDTISGNTASNGGGGFYSDSSDSINNSVLSGNTVTKAGYEYGGGGLYNDGPTTITNSTITGNSVTVTGASAGGGGIFNDDALSMTGSTVSGNKVLGSVASSGGGGIFNYSSGTVTNSTITGNSSSIGGGGIEIGSSSALMLINATIFKNAATGGGGNIDDPYGITLANSIVAGGTAASGPDVSSGANVSSDDYNIFGTAIAGLSSGAHDLQATDPKLLALNNNGGSTMTNADQSTSPGKARIPFAASMCNGYSISGVDQRNFTRGAGGKCDVGAFELGGTPSTARVHAPAVRIDPHHKHHQQPQAHVRPQQHRQSNTQR
jgi:hypothetical protein